MDGLDGIGLLMIVYFYFFYYICRVVYFSGMIGSGWAWLGWMMVGFWHHWGLWLEFWIAQYHSLLVLLLFFCSSILSYGLVYCSEIRGFWSGWIGMDEIINRDFSLFDVHNSLFHAVFIYCDMVDKITGGMPPDSFTTDRHLPTCYETRWTLLSNGNHSSTQFPN